MNPENKREAQVVIIGNYAPDRQFSMRLYAAMLQTALAKHGIPCQMVTPPVRAAQDRDSTSTRIGKWLGYIDKYLLFPIKLRRLAAKAREGTIFHIIDHSNAVYAPNLRGRSVVVTCHDMLAIRGSLGDAEAWCPASRMGRLLQKWILSGLRRAPWLTCVSEYTREDVVKLTGRSDPHRIRTILSATNSPFRPMNSTETEGVLYRFGIPRETPFVLNVSSSLPRKNRAAVFSSFFKAREGWPELRLVIVGQPLSAVDQAALRQAQAESLVTCLQDVSAMELNALYSAAHALVFPSYSEGFGWPVIEAQSAGCPVICSDRTSIPEVAGEGAILVDPDDHAGLANAILDLREPAMRDALVAKGSANLSRFNRERWIDDHLGLYEEMLRSS